MIYVKYLATIYNIYILDPYHDRRVHWNLGHWKNKCMEIKLLKLGEIRWLML